MFSKKPDLGRVSSLKNAKDKQSMKEKKNLQKI